MGNAPTKPTKQIKTYSDKISTNDEIYTDLAKAIKVFTSYIIKIKIRLLDRTQHAPWKHDTIFTICASYEKNETIKNIIDVMSQYMTNKFYPIHLKINFIDGDQSFIDETITITGITEKNYSDLINKSITYYTQTDIIEKGLIAEVFVKYDHKVSNKDITCKYMINEATLNPTKCPIYFAMKEEYQFDENNLYHLNEFSHFKDEYIEKSECKYNERCKSYIRLEKGGNQLKDLCHIKLFRHPPRNRNIKLSTSIHSLIVHSNKKQNKKIYEPTKEDKTKYNFNDLNGFLNALIEEVVKNGFESDLFLNDEDAKNKEYSLLNIVDEKMESVRHKMMDSPLRRDHMLALILYTGCECNYALCWSQRNGNYVKWRWLDYCLYKAIHFLNNCESASFPVYSGLNNVKLDKKFVKCGYFVTYVSTSWSKNVAKSFMNGDGMIIQMHKSFQNNGLIRCCDVSWISKFPDECELLFARSTTYGFDGFGCTVLDESQGVQTVSLRHDSCL